MKRILITGATGNIGTEVIRFLIELNTGNKVIAGVRNIETAKEKFHDISDLDFVTFDFEDPATFNSALESIDLVFLLRPPHISDIEKYFKPLISTINEKHVSGIVFLSVQGAEKSSIIPHNKIEKLIKAYNINYIFLRPSYFMQNLTTTLLPDIKTKRKIILPAAKAKFNWVDVVNIGEAGAILLNRFSEFMNRAIELTGYENENFYKVTELINNEIEDPIIYESSNPLRFYRIKKLDGMEKGMIMVMIMLHFVPRFQKEPKISGFYEELTGNKPTTLKQFIKREKNNFNP